MSHAEIKAKEHIVAEGITIRKSSVWKIMYIDDDSKKVCLISDAIKPDKAIRVSIEVFNSFFDKDISA